MDPLKQESVSQDRSSKVPILQEDVEKAPPPQHQTLSSWYRQHQFRTLSTVAAIVIILGLSLGLGLGIGIGSKSTSSSCSSPSSANNGLAQSTLPSSCASKSLVRVDENKPALWQPAIGTPWQIVLDNPINASAPLSPAVPIFDIDMFGNTADTFSQMHQQGKKVICYFNAGAYQPNLPDNSSFTAKDLGKQSDHWKGEYYLDTNSANVRNIMAARITLAASKGCDAIDADNIDTYTADTGFNLTDQTALNYLSFLAVTASDHNLSIGLKNADAILPNATCLVEFAITESCAEGEDCSAYQPMIQAGKPVFSIEYPDGTPGNVTAHTLMNLCQNITGMAGFSEIIKDRALDGWVEYCDGMVGNTSVVA